MIVYSLTIEEELSVLRTLCDCNRNVLHDETRRNIQKNIQRVADAIACRVCNVENYTRNESD